MNGITICHTGSVASFTIRVSQTGRQFVIEHTDRRQKKLTVRLEESVIDGLCPSPDGSVIYCLLKNGNETFVDSKSGKFLPKQAVRDQGVKFYS